MRMGVAPIRLAFACFYCVPSLCGWVSLDPNADIIAVIGPIPVRMGVASNDN